MINKKEDIKAILLRVPPECYGNGYDAALLDQYKIYVEMADRVSARRMLVNSFFWERIRQPLGLLHYYIITQG